MNLLDCIQTYFWKRRLHKEFDAVKRNFRTIKCPQNIEEDGFHLNNDEVIASFIYKDETWNYIKNIHEYLDSINRCLPIKYEDNFCEGQKYQVVNGNIVVSSTSKNDNWLCFYLRDILPKQYMFRFKIKLFSEFTEVQVAFRYENLGERHRFLLRDNKELAFESVHKGKFYHSLFSVPLSFVKGEEYEIKVYVLQSSYVVFINGEVYFCVTEKKQFSSGNDFCLILWNSTDKAPVECVLSDFKLTEVS